MKWGYFEVAKIILKLLSSIQLWILPGLLCLKMCYLVHIWVRSELAKTNCKNGAFLIQCSWGCTASTNRRLNSDMIIAHATLADGRENRDDVPHLIRLNSHSTYYFTVAPFTLCLLIYRVSNKFSHLLHWPFVDRWFIWTYQISNLLHYLSQMSWKF